jgi:pilus assembly protein CpaE
MAGTRRSQSGQAAAELVALLPLAALLVAGAWQLALAGHAVWAAGSAARAGARAAAVGADPRAAARDALPDRLARRLRVHDAGGGTIEVTLPVPRVLGLPVLGHASATAHFRPQR